MADQLNNTTEPFFLKVSVSPSWETKLKLKDRLQYLLLQKGISQNQLADAVGVNKGTMSKIMHEVWEPTSKVKISMAKVLGVDSLIIFGPQQYFLEYQKSFVKIEEEKCNNR